MKWSCWRDGCGSFSFCSVVQPQPSHVSLQGTKHIIMCELFGFFACTMLARA